MERLKSKNSDRRLHLTGLVDEARSMLNAENVNIGKLTGIHGRLFRNAQLLKISGEFSDCFMAAESQAAAEYSDLAMNTLAEIRSMIVALDPYFENVLQAQSAKSCQRPVYFDCSFSNCQPTPQDSSLPREASCTAKSPADTPGFVTSFTGIVVHFREHPSQQQDRAPSRLESTAQSSLHEHGRGSQRQGWISSNSDASSRSPTDKAPTAPSVNFFAEVLHRLKSGSDSFPT